MANCFRTCLPPCPPVPSRHRTLQVREHLPRKPALQVLKVSRNELPGNRGAEGDKAKAFPFVCSGAGMSGVRQVHKVARPKQEWVRGFGTGEQRRPGESRPESQEKGRPGARWGGGVGALRNWPPPASGQRPAPGRRLTFAVEAGRVVVV
jgi:hypothetical protein